MTNNKQQTAVELFIEQLEEKGKAYEENQVVRTINICIDVSDYMELKVQAKEMERQQKQISYAEGYAEGYKRGLEIIKWNIENQLKKTNENTN
jgi:cell division FtsZ-interacting protein ZapD